MDILIHSNFNPQNSHGGIEVVVAQLISVISPMEHSVTCFYGDNFSSSQRVGNTTFVSRRVIGKLFGAPLLSCGNLKLLQLGKRSQVIIFQEPFPLLWPAVFFLRYVLKKRVVVLIHADPAAHHLVKTIYNTLRRLVFRGAVCVTTSPNLAKKVFASSFRSCEVIPLCMPEASGIQHYLDESLPTRFALYIGRLANYKGLEVLLEAAKLAPQTTIVIAGDGPLKALVHDTIKSFKLENVFFIDNFISEAEKQALIQKSSFLIFPSTSVNEAFGLVQLEAMRASKPIINTFLDTGVNYVAPNNVCALTVQPSNPEELAIAIRKIWDSDALGTSLGSQGRQRYCDFFSPAKFESSWIDLIKREA